MKYYILELNYSTLKSLVTSEEYIVVDIRDIKEPVSEINNRLVFDIVSSDFQQKSYLGKIYFKTNDLIELADKINELKQERRKITCYAQK